MVNADGIPARFVFTTSDKSTVFRTPRTVIVQTPVVTPRAFVPSHVTVEE
jgi:hypothetical protein